MPPKPKQPTVLVPQPSLQAELFKLMVCCQPVSTPVFQYATDDEELKAALAEVRDDSSPVNWLVAAALCRAVMNMCRALVGYENASMLAYLGKGTGGISELATKLNDDEVFYALFRTTAQYDKSTR